jgi:adenylate kinase family enzyme
MEKIVIIGASGAGKTTLAKKMHSILKIKVVHLDRVFWKRGWQPLSRDERMDALQNLVIEKQWIIEGSYLDLSEPRLEAADTIVFLDTHPFICLWRIWRRHLQDGEYYRRDIPLESMDRLTPYRIFRVLTFPFREGKWLNKKLHAFPQKKVLLLPRKQVEPFLMQLEKGQFDETLFRGKNKISRNNWNGFKGLLNRPREFF